MAEHFNNFFSQVAELYTPSCHLRTQETIEGPMASILLTPTTEEKVADTVRILPSKASGMLMESVCFMGQCDP